MFAPTDEAFAKLPEGTVEALLQDKDKLRSILLYHVVPGSYTSKEVVKLNEAKTAIDEYVDGPGATSSSPGDWFFSNLPWMRRLRHGYLHFSAYFGGFGGTNQPQFTNNDPMNGTRQRIIQNG